MNSLVSVIVPVYNTEKYLSECIESILRQSYFDIELLLVDDGSPDNSGKICDYYATIDKRVRVIHQSNQGVSRARNAALHTAQGKWVTFVDSDDTINTDYIENLVSTNPLFDKWTLAVSGATRIDRNTNICRWKQEFVNRTISITSLSKEDWQLLDSILLFGTTWGKLYNLGIIRTNGIKFDERLSLNEDQLFFFKYLKYVNIIVSNDNVGYNYYTDGSASLSTSLHPYNKRITAYEELHQAYEALLDKFKLHPSALKKISSLICRIYLDAIKNCFAMHEDKETCLYVLRNLNKRELRNWFIPKSLSGFTFKVILNFPSRIPLVILKYIYYR